MSAAAMAASFMGGYPPPYVVEVLRDTPIAYWRLGEPAGTSVVDQVGSFPGLYTGSPTLGLGGAIVDDTDTSVSFASGKYADFGNVLGLVGSSFSIEFWYRISAAQLTASPSFAPIYTKGDNASGANGIRIARNSTSSTQFQFVSGASSFTPAGTLTADDGWHHVVFTYNASDGKCRIYVDGALKSEAAGSAPQTNAFATRIGGNAQQTTRYWPGRIDDVSVYNYALSDARVARHYQTGIGISPAITYAEAVAADAPWGWWRLTEASGTTLADASGHSHSLLVPDGAPTLNIDGPHGKGIDFPSSASTPKYYLGTSDTLTPVAPLTLEAWVYITAAVASVAEIMSFSTAFAGAGTGRGIMQVESGKLGIVTYNPSLGQSSALHGTPLVLNAWNHCVCVWDEKPGNSMMYVNGFQQAHDETAFFETDNVSVFVHGGGQTTSNDWRSPGAMKIAEPAAYIGALSQLRVSVHRFAA